MRSTLQSACTPILYKYNIIEKSNNIECYKLYRNIITLKSGHRPPRMYKH